MPVEWEEQGSEDAEVAAPDLAERFFTAMAER